LEPQNLIIASPLLIRYISFLFEPTLRLLNRFSNVFRLEMNGKSGRERVLCGDAAE